MLDSTTTEPTLPIELPPETPEKDAETTTEEPKETEKEVEANKEKSAVQRRIDQLVYERKRAENENARLMAMLEKTIPDKQKPEPQKEPTEFGTIEEYTDYLVEKKIQEKMKVVDQKFAEKQHHEEQDHRISTFKEKADRFIETNPDFYSVINDPTLPTTETLADALIESDKGPEVAYYLGKHPDELAKIVAMPPYKQVLALGKIEARLDSGGVPTKSSNAPAPLNTIKKGGVTNEEGPSDKMSMNDWVKAETARLKKIGRLR